MSVLEVIYHSKEKDTLLSTLYECPPFCNDVALQQAGNVIRYALWLTKDIQTQTDQGGYTLEEWLSYKQVIFNNMIDLVIEHIDEFTVHESSCVLHSMATMLTKDLKALPSVPQVIDCLLNRLYFQCQSANAQDLSNGLWAIAKLVEAGLIALETVSTEMASELLMQLQAQHQSAKTQNLTNGFWAIGIIFFKKNPFTPTQKSELIAVINALLAKRPSLQREHQQQLCISIGLLGWRNEVGIDTVMGLECALRPPIQGKIHPRVQELLENCQFEQEACVHGFFVDFLVTPKDGGKRVVIEIDGPHHQETHQSRFDAFRDGVLKFHGIEVIRVDTVLYHQYTHAFFRPVEFQSDMAKVEERSRPSLGGVP
jgi:hypothetical protein